MNEILTVNIPENGAKSYPIYINDEDFDTLKTKLKEEIKGRNLLIVISEKVFKINVNLDPKMLNNSEYFTKDFELPKVSVPAASPSR